MACYATDVYSCPACPAGAKGGHQTGSGRNPMGAYEPGWSPEEMRAAARAVEESLEELIMLLRDNQEATGRGGVPPQPWLHVLCT